MRAVLVGIRRWFGFGLILVLSGLFALGLSSGLHPAQVGVWVGWQALMPLVGLVVLIATIVQMARLRRVTRPSLVLSLLAALVAIAFAGLGALPYLPSSLERTQPSVAVRLPLDGPVRVAWGGDAKADNYHVTVPDQRWAYDLVVEPAFVGTERLEDYGCYGLPVRAPAGGTVVLARDGEPDQAPGTASGALPLEGNAVVLRLERTGTHLLLAHLKDGSVAVAEGQRIAEGDVVGACGNSGNTSEPHVHIHHQREAPGTAPPGLAQGLPLTFRDHDGEPMPTGGFGKDGTPRGDVVRHRGG